ncbi:MAG: hypothetical protein EOP14_07805, partial [Pseudomonas sp.]
MNSLSKNCVNRIIQTLCIPALAIGFTAGAVAQGTSPAMKKDMPVAMSAKDMKTQPATMQAMRASKLIGMKVNGAQGKDVG